VPSALPSPRQSATTTLSSALLATTTCYAVADGHPDGFCKLIADRSSHLVLGAHVLGEYSAEDIQVVATAMSTAMTVGQLADVQFAFTTYTEAASMAAQKVCRTVGVGDFPIVWNYLADQP
jgi:hypothetical protein